MYVRQTDPNRQRVKIPENYSGHAFRDTGPYGDMPPPVRLDLPHPERKPPPDRDVDATENYASEPADIPPESRSEIKNEDVEVVATKKAEKDVRSSPFSALLPTSFASAEHFPFGHGIGSEEILILAMMLMVFLSDKNGEPPDHELLLLLGLLLFAG